jgi:glycosyltransferase involved in cell wall biosynthesis
MPSICLNMIVRDESAVIDRCLESVKPHIDHWVIVDTGSSDDTIRRIEASLSGTPGEVHQQPFIDFATSRNAALELALDKADYLLLIDADMTFSVESDDLRGQLSAEGYYVRTMETHEYSNLRLIRTDKSWMYHGVTHEFLLSRDARDIGKLATISTLHHLDGSSRVDKDSRDRRLLEAAIESDPDDGHAWFYLARIDEREGNLSGSLRHYDAFLAAGQRWDDEWVWYANYRRGIILEQLEEPLDRISVAWLDAYAIRPQRAEPLYHLARLHRERGNLVLAELYADKALRIPKPDDLFDLDPMIYKWRIPAEFALVSYRLGRHTETIRAANRALEDRSVLRNARDSLIASRQRSIEHLYRPRRVDPEPDTIHRIRVVVPFRNAGAYIEPCIASLKRQNHPNFFATFIDDASDDGSPDLIPRDDPRFDIITNDKRMGPLFNRMTFIMGCDEDDIVVYVDGDDQLASDDALSWVNTLYNRYQCWMTYGQFVTQNGNLGWAVPYPSPGDFTEMLDAGNMKFPVHPLTHRAGLFQRIADYDPAFNVFRDDDGEWLFYASDAVIARPLLHLAGWDRVLFNNRVIYLYTEGHDISESLHNRSDQMRTCAVTMCRIRLPRIGDYRKRVE